MKTPTILFSMTVVLTLSSCSTQQVVGSAITVTKLPVKAVGVVAGTAGSVVGGTVGGIVAGGTGARLGSAAGRAAANKAATF